MKTTIELAPALLDSAKRLARREGRTLRALVEEGLRHVLASRGSRPQFRLPDARFKGRGVQPGVEEGRWADIRDQIYEGRGA
jgi:hypothetical protein